MDAVAGCDSWWTPFQRSASVPLTSYVQNTPARAHFHAGEEDVMELIYPRMVRKLKRVAIPETWDHVLGASGGAMVWTTSDQNKSQAIAPRSSQAVLNITASLMPRSAQLLIA
jgi:hypothetical protein